MDYTYNTFSIAGGEDRGAARVRARGGQRRVRRKLKSRADDSDNTLITRPHLANRQAYHITLTG